MDFQWTRALTVDFFNALIKILKKINFALVAVSEKDHTMENEYLRVKINEDSTLNITDKNSGKEYKGLHYFEDVGEFGQAIEFLKK